MKLVKDENSYFTVEEADEMIPYVFDSKSNELKMWNELSEQDKELIIVSSTELLESNFMFLGRKERMFQSLAFPRINRYGQRIPVPDKYLRCILVQGMQTYLSRSSEYNSLQDAGIKVYQVEGAKVEFHSNSDRDKIKDVNGIYQSVKTIMREYTY